MRCGEDVVFMLSVKFFCFKQKAGYEMRISDWSADVCSSVLLAREWDNLVCRCKKDEAEPLLIFLTADFNAPVEQIRESAAEYSRKRPHGRFACAWLSRSEERRVGKACVSTCRYRWSPTH